jgi:hypothetical protein
MSREPPPFPIGHRTAICVSLPDLAGLVDRWRLPTVRVARCGLPRHVTLLFPWRRAPLSPADLAALADALAGVPPFRVTLRLFGRFPGHLFLDPEPGDVIRGLIGRLVSAFPDTPPYGGRFPDPVPHVTIAEAATEAELARLEREISDELSRHLPLVYPIAELVVFEEDAEGMWSARSRIALAAG